MSAHGTIEPGKGIDEITTATENQVFGIGSLSDLRAIWKASDFGMPQAPFSDLLGGDLQANLAMVDSLLSGQGPKGLVDTIILNAAVGLWLTGRVKDVKDAIPELRELLLGGAVRAKIKATREFYSTVSESSHV